jgi:hypothetical protein
MTKGENALEQPGLFDAGAGNVRIEEVVRYALGDFQSRGLDLAGRKLALDRLLGAFKRSFERFGIEPLNDAELAEALSNAGALVEEVPGYVAKHPYRVTVPASLADAGLELFNERSSEEASESA